ncbi:MAG TPA: DUF885 domain-containing protein [Candidatus Eisenbacteria bacterium]|jgi:uncharacterized protein (DUF885 family)|nr:DUF885 domain-containing protein [Candidatus Eisenbacteria bacterium]
MSKDALLALADEYVDTSLRLDPVLATLVGVHDHDGELGDPSLGAARRRIEWLRGLEARLDGEIDESALTPAERIDARFLRSCVRGGLLVWEGQKEAERAAQYYPDTCLIGLYLLLSREFAPLAERKEPMIERLGRVRAYLQGAQRTLTAAPKLFAEIADESAEAGVGFVEELRGLLAAEFPEEKSRIDAACDDARAGFEEYRAWLAQSVIPQATAGFAVGRETFDARLAEEHLLPYDAVTLEELGWQLLRDTQAEMERVAQKIAPGKSYAEVIEGAKDRTLAADGLLEAYRTETARVRSFVVEKRLAPIPDGEELLVVDTPAFDRSRTPYAAYMYPGPFDSVQRGQFFVTPVDRTKPEAEQQEQLRGHNVYGVALTALHEAYPGHHLQLCWANRTRSRLRKMADSSVLAEGWALYCEQLFFEQGYYSDPLVRLFQLKDQAWRAARVVIDCRLHTGAMSFDEAVDFLVKETLLERTNAIAEVKRYTTSPTQPMSYLTGKKVILDLREEMKGRLGSRFDLHDFHAAVLQAGTLPVTLVADEVRERFGVPAAETAATRPAAR